MATTSTAEKIDNAAKATGEKVEKAPSKVRAKYDEIVHHPMTKRMGRNTLRFGLVGTAFTIADEAVNGTSWTERSERVGVLYNPK